MYGSTEKQHKVTGTCEDRTKHNTPAARLGYWAKVAAGKPIRNDPASGNVYLRNQTLRLDRGPVKGWLIVIKCPAASANRVHDVVKDFFS